MRSAGIGLSPEYDVDLWQEYPYLTISQAIDARAGIKYSARHCFTYETISINLKPTFHASDPGYDIPLRDDLWSQLLGKGKVCGDERWLIGENRNQQIVILHFEERIGVNFTRYFA